MSNKIIQLNEGAIKQELKELIRNSVDWEGTQLFIGDKNLGLLEAVVSGQVK